MHLNLTHIVDIIEDHYAETDFTPERIAEQLGISYSYLREELQRHYGVNPYYLIETIRLEKSLDLLMRNEQQINRISRQVGYDNPKTFREAFRRRLGICPVHCLDKNEIVNSRLTVLYEKFLPNTVKNFRQKFPSKSALAQVGTSVVSLNEDHHTDVSG